MNKTFLFLLLLLTFFISTGQAQWQQTYPLSNSDKTAIVKDVNTKLMQGYCSQGFYVGNDSYHKRRAFFQWNLPDNIIPDGSTIKSARLYITDISNSNNIQMDARLYSVRLDLNQASADSLWARTDLFNNRTDYYITYAQSHSFVIDETYTEGSPFTDALQTAIVDNYFTLGMLDSREVTHTYDFNMTNCSVNLEIQYELPNVVIDQKRSDNVTSVGTVGKWESSAWAYYAVPDTIPFVNNESLVLLGMQSKVTGPDEKYNNWNNLPDVRNYHIFTVSSKSKHFTSHLDPIDGNVQIENKLISSGANNSGSVSFTDPWLNDSLDATHGNIKRNQGMFAPFKSRQSPFSPDYTTGYNGDVYQGVFLGQGYDNPNKPYYSVKASASQTATAHGETVSYAFDRWGGTGVQYQSPDNRETPVVFNNAGAVAEARYKGHLVSSTSTATGPNGSRVLVRSRKSFGSSGGHSGGPIYLLFMAYADGGETWFTISENDGVSFDTEKRVSDGNGNCYNPSIATLDEIAYMTWAQKVGSTWYLRYRTYNRGSNTWGNAQTIATFSSTTTPTPQIALTENPLRVMVASNVNGNVKSWLRKNGSWQYAGLNVSGSQPVLCADEVIPDLNSPHYFGDIALVYTYNNDIYLRNWNTSNESWSAAKKVSVQNMFSLGNQHASVSYYDGSAYVAWRALNDEIGSNSIYERSWNSYNNTFASQTTVIEGSDDSFDASVSKNSSLIVAYRNGGTVYKAKKSGSWTRTTIGSGRYPSITPHYNETLIYNKYNSAPYLLKHHYEAPAGGGGTPPPGAKISAATVADTSVQLMASRRLIYTFGDASLSVDIANARFGSQKLTWSDDDHSDTLKSVGSGELTLDISALQKNAFAADQPNTTLFNIYFVSGGTETLLRAFRLNDLKPATTDQRQGATQHLVLATRQSRDGYFRIGLAGNSPREYTVLHASHTPAPLAKATESAGGVLALPVTYSLGQNYPNPFNPVTHIRFALPQAGNVTLTVYDMTGRVVSTLVNGYKAAGRYDVTFDGTNLASGAYVYRLQAGSNFVETKKLLLLK